MFLLELQSLNWKTDFGSEAQETLSSLNNPKTPIPLDRDSATIRNFGQNDTNRNRNGKTAVEAPMS